MTSKQTTKASPEAKTETSSVFLSYKQEDVLQATKIALELEKEGFDVWWDRELPPAENWRIQRQNKLAESKCVVVLWSHDSVGPKGDFVRDEAGRAKRRGILVPVLIDKVDIPLGFGELQAIDLSKWNAKADSPEFQDLCSAIIAKLSGVAPPPAIAPLHRLRRKLTLAGIASTLLLGTGGLLFNAFGLQGQLCKLPVGQPAISDFCGAIGIGNSPTKTERLAWDEIRTNHAKSCEVLKAHITRFPSGHFSGFAADLLAAKREIVTEYWQTNERRLPFYQAQSLELSNSETSAQSNSLSQSQLKADRECKAFASTTEFKFVSSQVKAENWNCETFASGVSCGFEGQVACKLQERHENVTEECGA